MTSNAAFENGQDPIARALRTYAQNILVAVFGLLPLFFVPTSLASLEHAKITFAVVGVLAALTLLSLSVLRAGTVRVGVSYPIICLWCIVLVAFVSSLLSGDIADAMLGDFMTTQSTAFLALMALVTSVWVFVSPTKQAVTRFYLLLAISTTLLVVFHVVRLFFGSDTIPFGIFTDTVSTPVGSWNDLALFLGLVVMLVLVFLDQVPLRPREWTFYVGIVVLALGMLMVINFFVVWLVLGLVSLSLVVYTLTKNRPGDTKVLLPSDRTLNIPSLILSLCVFVTSAFFVIGGPSLGAFISEHTGISYIEVRPSVQATADVARHVYNEHALLGIGPNKFVDAWRAFKDPAINTSVFWNTDFFASNGYITTFFITLGFLGVVAWIVFLGAFLLVGVRILMCDTSERRIWYFLGISSFVAGIYIWGMSFVYVPGAVILMLGAIFTGITIAAERILTAREQKAFSFTVNRRIGLLVTLMVIAVIVASVNGIYTVVKHYTAVQEHNRGMQSLEAGAFEESIRHFERAFSLHESDTYKRRSAEALLMRLHELLAVPSPGEAEVLAYQETSARAIDAARQATVIDPKEADNWTLLGNIYSLLMSVGVEGVYDQAKDVLTKARDLNPKNPLTTLNLAVLEGRQSNYDAARTLTEEAIILKPNFSDAFFYLSQIDIVTGNVDGAIRATRSIIALEPQNPVRHYQLGVLLTAREAFGEATVAFEQAVKLDPNYANALYLLALSYDRLGRGEDARLALEKVFALNPDNQEVRALIDILSTGGKLTGAPDQPEQNVVIEGTTGTISENGTVLTNTDPDTPLVTPVNTIPQTE